MNPEQANACAAYLFSVFPSLNSDQVREWALEFEAHQYEDVRAAIRKHHRESPDGFCRGKDLLGAVKLAERARKQHEDVARRAREDQEAKAHLDRIDQTIAGMSDRELGIRKAAVLAQLPDGRAKSLLRDRDPRRSAWLKGLICEQAASDKLAEVL